MENISLDKIYVNFTKEAIKILSLVPDEDGGKAEIREKFMWTEIVKVCILSETSHNPEVIKIFTKKDNYFIPTDASRGLDLWEELIKRGFLEAKNAK